MACRTVHQASRICPWTEEAAAAATSVVFPIGGSGAQLGSRKDSTCCCVDEFRDSLISQHDLFSLSSLFAY